MSWVGLLGSSLVLGIWDEESSRVPSEPPVSTENARDRAHRTVLRLSGLPFILQRESPFFSPLLSPYLLLTSHALKAPGSAAPSRQLARV